MTLALISVLFGHFYIPIFLNMAEETTVTTSSNKGSNTTGLVALILAIIGLLLTISIIASPIGIILLVLALLLGIIWLFKAPRGKAIAGIIISLVSFFAIGYTVYWTASSVYEPVKEFALWMDEEARTNTEFRLVFKQPGFEKFLEQRMEERIRTTNRSELPKVGSPKKLLSFYTTFFLNELQAEIPLAIDAWIEKYGLPSPEDDLMGLEQNTPNQDEWKMDDDVELNSGINTDEIEIFVDPEDNNNEIDPQELEQLLNSLDE